MTLLLVEFGTQAFEILRRLGLFVRLAGVALASAFFVIQTKRWLRCRDQISRVHIHRFPFSFCHRSMYLQGKVRHILLRRAQLDLLVLRLQGTLADHSRNF